MFEKIQIEVLRSAKKRDADGKRFEYRYGYFDDNHVAITESHAVYIIPKERFYLNEETVFRNDSMNFGLVFKHEGDSEHLIFTNQILQFDKLKLNVLMNVNDDTPIYVNSKLLSTFDEKWKTVSYRGTDSKSPVYVYHDDELVGLVLPVKPKEG